MDPESIEESAQAAKKVRKIREDKSKVIRRIHRTDSESIVDQSKELKCLCQLFSESNFFYIIFKSENVVLYSESAVLLSRLLK